MKVSKRERTRPLASLLSRIAALSVLIISAPFVAQSAWAATMTATGPLTEIETTPDLNCRVEHISDSASEFYGRTACATLVTMDGVLYGPAQVPAGSEVQDVAWTPVSQDSGGVGTVADPYWINTVVSGGSLTVTQRDTYVNGENSYRTSISVTSTEPGDIIIYHGGDCYLQNSDNGFSEQDPVTGATTCRAVNETGDAPGERIEQYVPLTGGNTFMVGYYDSVWAAIATMLPLPNTVYEGFTDNGMALAWSYTLPAGGSASVSLLTNFSPIGVLPLPTTLTPADATTPVTDANTITATVQNPNVMDVTLSDLVVTLSDGLTYVPGTTTGAGEPTVSGQTLTFAGPIPVAAGTTVPVTFDVTSDTAGSYGISLMGHETGGAPVLESNTTVVFEGVAPTPTPTPTPTPEPTPTPTPTPEPTVSPTSTAEPTPTPPTTTAPTPTPSPTQSAALAQTGVAESTPYLGSALVLMVAGAVLVMGARRGQRNEG